MKSIHIKSNFNAEYNVGSNAKDPKFQVNDHVRISKDRNIFAKVYTPNWWEEVFLITKIKNTVRGNYAINDINGEEIVGTFYETELQKTNQKEY